MGMFVHYDNIANYTPDNMSCNRTVGKSYTKLDPVKASKPFEEYDVHGNLIGYFWHYGETLNLEFNIDGEITVEDDAVILTVAGATPPVSDCKVNQRAYNIVDQTSWTCISEINNQCAWRQDDDFTYPEDGVKSVYLSAKDYLKDKSAKIVIYNFRYEPILTKIINASTRIILPIDIELSNKLTKGIYYCSLNVFNSTVNMPVFTANDCKLLVK